MAEPSGGARLNELRKRINELNNQSTRVLIFLSLGIGAIILLWTTDLLSDLQSDLLLDAMRWWVLAILPTVLGILPLKEIRENNPAWYGSVRWIKFVLLWLAIICILLGTTYFLRSILLPPPPSDNTQSTILRCGSNSSGSCFLSGGPFSFSASYDFRGSPRANNRERVK